MTAIFDELRPGPLWKHFAEILKIPHCSGNEKPLGDYIISVAQRLGLSWKRDKVGNVVISKPASPGHEKAAGVILQGHLDMVGEKNSDVEHDFSRDPIKAERNGDWIQAQGTTLGSDNGIGVAAALAVLEDENLVHGPLECLFTVDEETGLTGANKLKKGFLQGRMLLNLDSEEEGAFTIGCSGGVDSEIALPLQRTRQAAGEVYRLKLFGFRGGHSGLDIHQGRANAIRLLARLLWSAQEKFRLKLVDCEGGNKRNAIPREAWADMVVERAVAKKLQTFFQAQFAFVQNEYKAVEKEAGWSFEGVGRKPISPLALASQKTLLRLLLSLPHGVISMHPEIPGLVETSTNLAIVRCEKKNAQIVCSSRSSVATALSFVRQIIRATAELAGARIVQPGGYPGWEPNLQSELLRRLTEVYRKVFNKEPAVKAVHAGLECGIIGEKFPGMDMISFGPTIQNPHSPQERVHIGSVENFWKFLTSALESLAE
ncbi:MAG: aminoacyl-histidine dipeptidase [Candidatus Aminicenantales bacterium]